MLIGNRYELHEQIGTGGMGTVYRAIDGASSVPVAVKVLKAEAIADDPQMLERFAREADALRQLNHPNIVKVLDTVHENDQHYIVMEYIPGGRSA